MSIQDVQEASTRRYFVFRKNEDGVSISSYRIRPSKEERARWDQEFGGESKMLSRPVGQERPSADKVFGPGAEEEVYEDLYLEQDEAPKKTGWVLPTVISGILGLVIGRLSK